MRSGSPRPKLHDGSDLARPNLLLGIELPIQTMRPTVVRRRLLLLPDSDLHRSVLGSPDIRTHSSTNTTTTTGGSGSASDCSSLPKLHDGSVVARPNLLE